MDRMDGGDRKGRPYRLCGNIRGGRAHPLVCLGSTGGYPRGQSAPTFAPLRSQVFDECLEAGEEGGGVGVGDGGDFDF